MGTLNYSIVGGYNADVTNAIENMRTGSEAFRNVENEVSQNYQNIVIVVGANVVGIKDAAGVEQAAAS